MTAASKFGRVLKEKSRSDTRHRANRLAAMPLPDEALELILHFLLAEKGAGGELKLVAQPVCRLLQTRRLRGFEWVTLEVCRMGL